MILELFISLAMAQMPMADKPRVEEVASVVESAASPREKVLAVAKSAIGWREATGNNDGANVERILRSVGMGGSRAPYCAAFCFYCYQEAGLGSKIPRSAWSPDMVASPTWKRGRGETPRPADIFGIWFQSKGRVAHAGLIEKWGNGMAVTIEGNTGPQAEPGTEADRNGDGVWRRWRPTASIYAAKNYL
jgi:hypothetical protein